MSNYDQFRDKLREIFMMNHAELDFGIYRIMNQKRDEINNFLDKVLLPQVKKILGSSNTDAIKALQQDFEKAVKQCEDLEIDPNTSNKVIELREKIAASSAGNEELENEVFNHLTIFFSRYYDNGDFVSKRRYKDNAYAIPYNGEEVKLHWANSDQYYIKTSEYFQNYTFNVTVDEKTNARKKVHFVLKDVTTEQNNNKAASGMERRFALYQDEEAASIEVIQNEEGKDELNIYFTYELMSKGTKQDDLMATAFSFIKENLPEGFSALITTLSPTEKDKKRTLLQKHLKDYTDKNQFDYFIHKDLGGFLRRELDFYIKNEVLLIDDLDEKHVMQQLNQVRAIKGVGEKIISMLAQIEDFQKRLWLKKKFVVQSDYCITLDCVPESFYAEICENEAQRKEWVRLFAIDEIEGDASSADDLFSTGAAGYSEPLSEEFLRQNPYLVLDTAFFSTSFKHRLQSKMEDVDKNCNGLLINSENFQALKLLQEKYTNTITCTYIDPPYNAKSSEILYKNTFKHSSWLSLMENRITIGRNLLQPNGVFEVAIDEIENARLTNLCDDVFSDFTGRADVSIVINPSGQQGKNFSTTNEFVHFYFQDIPNMLAKEIRSEENADVRGFMNGAKGEGGNYLRTSGKTCFYPIFVQNNQVVGFGDVCEDNFHPSSANINVENGITEVYPIDGDGVERKWLFGRETVDSIKTELSVKINRNTRLLEIIRTKTAINYKTVWIDSLYSAKEYGTNLLSKMFNKQVFSFPKSLFAVKDCIGLATREHKNAIILDYFGGSGTTAHAGLLIKVLLC